MTPIFLFLVVGSFFGCMCWYAWQPQFFFVQSIFFVWWGRMEAAIADLSYYKYKFSGCHADSVFSQVTDLAQIWSLGVPPSQWLSWCECFFLGPFLQELHPGTSRQSALFFNLAKVASLFLFVQPHKCSTYDNANVKVTVLLIKMPGALGK